MKEYNVTIVYTDGRYSNTMNFKAENKGDVLAKISKDKMRDVEDIVTITVLEKVPYRDSNDRR